MLRFGEWLGARLEGGEMIELVGDVGAGKTTFTRGLAKGLEIIEPIQSPTFTVSREYEASQSRRLAHYDFYRLGEAGLMAEEIQETISEPGTVTVVEWSDVVSDVLPAQRITLTIRPVAQDESAREVTWHVGEQYKALLQEAENVFTA
jgi:tRNA threonylcarbamoyladenosine biosynthesis protein TsaE